MAICLEQSEGPSSMAVPGGLSQAELDALCVSNDIEDQSDDEGSGFDDFILQVKRTRHFVSSEAAEALILDVMGQEKNKSEEIALVEDISLCLPSAGLSQEQLDALSVHNSEECGEPCLSEASADFLSRVKRTRHFLGDAAADALILATNTSKLRDIGTSEKETTDEDATDECATTASGHSSPPIGGGLSQAGLDGLSVYASEESQQPDALEGVGESLLRVRRRRHFMDREQMGDEQAEAFIHEPTAKMPEGTEVAAGLSQEELDAMAVRATDGEPCSPEGSDSGLYRVQRARHFMGEEVAQALISVAASKHGTNVGSGLSQEELDTLSVSVEDAGDEPRSGESFLLQVRRTRFFMGRKAADDLVHQASESIAKDAAEDKVGDDGSSRSTWADIRSSLKSQDDDDEWSINTVSESGSVATAPRVLASGRKVFPFSRCSTIDSVAGNALSQADLDNLSVVACEDVADGGVDASALTIPGLKVRGKVEGLCIDTECESPRSPIMKVATPNRRRSPGKASPTRSFAPSSPQLQHA
jgi:hypothetical protein